MNRKNAVLLMIALASFGCGKNAEESTDSPQVNYVTPEGHAPATAAIQIVNGEMKPDTIIAQVGKMKLDVGTAKMLIDFRIASIINQIPADRVETIKASMLKSTVEQFIEKSVLILEADKQKIAVTEEDQKKALDEVAANLPEGITIDQAMDQSPWGRDALMEEMIASIKTKKLISVLMSKDVAASDEEIDAFYEQNKAQLDQPERLSASHILIATTPEDSEEVKVDKRKQAEAIREKIIAGAEFEEMAKENSACSSGKMGGALGEFHRESPFVPEFKDAAFKQKVNEIGPIVETQFGYHIIKVTDKKDAEAIPRDKLTEIVVNQKKNEMIKTYIADLRAKTDITYGVEL